MGAGKRGWGWARLTVNVIATLPFIAGHCSPPTEISSQLEVAFAFACALLLGYLL